MASLESPASPTSPKNKNEFDLLTAVHAAEYDVLRDLPLPKNLDPAHKFTLELTNDTLTPEKFALYKKYQSQIHHEKSHEITSDQFERFLCSTPFRPKTYLDKITGSQRKTGTFHQLYRLDGKLIAFGVLDFLPNTISSVYFVYDADCVGRFGMGKVSAVREVALCIEEGYKYYGLGMHSGGMLG